MFLRSKSAEVAASILVYSVCSVSMIILNKLVMFTHDIDYPMGLLLIQNFGALLLVSFGKFMRWIHYPDFSMKVVRKWLPLTFFFILMLWTSMKSLRTMSVSVQTIIKNLAVILTAAGDSWLYNKRVTPLMYFSFFLMVLGGYMGVKGDPWVTTWGVIWTLVNVVSTVSYTLYMKQLLGDVSKEIGLYGPVFYNNLISLPFIFIASLPSYAKLVQSLENASFQALLTLLFMILIGSMMSFAVFWCMKETSPTTFTVIGAVNKAPLAIFGMVAFNQFPTPVGYGGIVIALSGGFLYTYLNVSETREIERTRSSAPQVEKVHSMAFNEDSLKKTLKNYV